MPEYWTPECWAPSIYNPCKNTGWTIVSEVPFAPLTVARLNLPLILMASDSSACCTPDWVTLMFFIDIEGSEGEDFDGGLEGGDVALQAIADIKWGTKNAKFKAEVDWRTGTAVHLPATEVEIRPVLLQAPAGNWTKIMFVAGLAPATIPQSKPTRSFGPITLAAAETLTLQIPYWTTCITAFPTDLAGGTPGPLVGISVHQLGGSVSGVFYDINTLDQYEAGCCYPIHGHARFIRFTNISGASITFSLMAELGL
jgi:hypothetical protein